MYTSRESCLVIAGAFIMYYNLMLVSFVLFDAPSFSALSEITNISFGLQITLWCAFCRLHVFAVDVQRHTSKFICALFRYDEITLKNHKPTLMKYQEEHFREHVYSYDPDVIYTFKVLILHMPPTSESTHIFLSPITHPEDHIWFKSNVNLGESMLRNFVRDMAAAAGLKGD